MTDNTEVLPARADADALAVPSSETTNSKIIATLDPEILGNVPIELEARIGRGSMTMSAFAQLKRDEIIPLDTPINGVIDLTLNGLLVARGEIVSVDDQFGVRITEILTRKS